MPWQPTELVLERSKRQLRVIKMAAKLPLLGGGWASQQSHPGYPSGAPARERSDLEQPLAQAAGGGFSFGPLGTRWIGFWYRCGKRSSPDRRPPRFVPDSCREIGFHGTGQLSSIGQAATFGCVRLRNQDAISLFDLVKEGDIVRVVP